MSWFFVIDVLNCRGLWTIIKKDVFTGQEYQPKREASLTSDSLIARGISANVLDNFSNFDDPLHVFVFLFHLPIWLNTSNTIEILWRLKFLLALLEYVGRLSYRLLMITMITVSVSDFVTSVSICYALKSCSATHPDVGIVDNIRIFSHTGCCIELVLFHWGVWQQKFLLQPTPLAHRNKWTWIQKRHRIPYLSFHFRVNRMSIGCIMNSAAMSEATWLLDWLPSESTFFFKKKHDYLWQIKSNILIECRWWERIMKWTPEVVTKMSQQKWI